MHQFFVSPEDINRNFIVIKGKEAKHAFSVRRLRTGDKVLVFNGTGKQYLGIVQSIRGKEGKIKIIKTIVREEPKIKITLAQAIPKKAKFDDIVDKATQLGVTRIIPLLSERTIVKVKTKKQEEKIKRWQQIALEAAKQCGCLYLPEVERIRNFSDLIRKSSSFDLAMIACCQAGSVYIKNILRNKKPKNIIIFIGPEGDFTQKEVETAQKNGCQAISLGKRVLRCDTAACAILSILNYEWED